MTSAASTTVMAGAAVVDITPPPGQMMCGYAARTEPATGTHDPLTARALVVGDTALVVADVLGFHEDSCARIRARSGFADDRVVVIATHTHGAPMPGRRWSRRSGVPHAAQLPWFEDDFPDYEQARIVFSVRTASTTIRPATEADAVTSEASLRIRIGRFV